MTEISWSLERKLNRAAGKSFKVFRLSGNAILFKNQVVEYDHFTLYCDSLTEAEVLEVAKILGEVYQGFSTRWNISASERYLNGNSEESGHIVRAVVNLESSALHKFLLLTSSEYFLPEEDEFLPDEKDERTKAVEKIIALVKAKKEFCSDTEVLVSSRNLFADLKNLYLLPGVSARSVMPASQSLDIAPSKMLSVEYLARIMAFATERAEGVSLKDALDLDFEEVISTEKSLAHFATVNAIRNLTGSLIYRDLAMSMTSSEAAAAGFMIPKIAIVSSIALPEEILKNRAHAMTKRSKFADITGADSVTRYMSADEHKKLSSATAAQLIDGLLRGSQIRAKTDNIVYAAIAEVFAVKGEARALEVARELKHLNHLKNSNQRIYAATAFLIAEALKPENDEMPFSWAAQLSEYGWVLTSHIPTEEESILENMIV
jgi:hypothetical protein